MISWDDYNQELRKRVDLDVLETKYAPVIEQLRDIQRQLEALAKQPPSDARDQQASALRQRAARLAGQIEAMHRDQPLFRVEGDLQQALAQAAHDLAEGRTPGWDPDAMAQDLAEMTRRARAAELSRRLSQIADAEQNTAQRLLPLAEHRRPTDGELLRLAELGGDEELLSKALDEWQALVRAWCQREAENLPREAGKLRELADAVADGDIAGLKRRSAATARAGDGREAHRLAAEARDLLLALLPAAERAGASATGGMALGAGWSPGLGGDLGGLLGAGGRWGGGGQGDGGLGLSLGYGGDDQGSSMAGRNAELFGPEELAAKAGGGQGAGGDPVADIAAAGPPVGFHGAARQTATARTTAPARSSLSPEERRVIEDYFTRLEADR